MYFILVRAKFAKFAKFLGSGGESILTQSRKGRGKDKACYVAFTTASTLLFLPLVLYFLIHSLMQYLTLEVSWND